MSSLTGPTPNALAGGQVDPEALREDVEKLLEQPTEDLAEEAALLAAAHEALHKALQ